MGPALTDCAGGRTLRPHLRSLNAGEIAVDVAAHRRGVHVEVGVGGQEDFYVAAHVLNAHSPEFRDVYRDLTVHVLDVNVTAGGVDMNVFGAGRDAKWSGDLFGMEVAAVDGERTIKFC